MGIEDSNKKDPVTTLDEIIGVFDDLHRKTSTVAQRLGQARQICLDMRPAWQTITNVASGNTPETQTLVTSNTVFMEAYNQELFQAAQEFEQSYQKLNQLTLGVDSLANVKKWGQVCDRCQDCKNANIR